jgi:hypothetical protein
MKYSLIVTGILILCILAAGCSEESAPDTSASTTTPVSTGAIYSAGDIVAKTLTQAQPLWLVIRFDPATEKYERAQIYKKADGSWGYRKDSKTELSDRETMEKVYPVKVAHVTVSAVQIVTPTVTTTTMRTTTTPSGPAPEITSITPSAGATGTSVTITNLAGNNFVSGATVQLTGPGKSPISASDVQTIGTKITCVFNLNGAATGKRNVVVTNPDGQSATLMDVFTVKEPGPVITGIDPFEGRIGEQLTISVSGSNFKDPARVYLVKGNTDLSGISETSITNVVVASSTQLTFHLSIPTGAPTGEWDVIVRNVADKQNSTPTRKFTISNST